MTFNVTKKNGNTELFDVEKIKQAIAFACEGLDVSPLALESKFDEFLYDGIPTKILQQNLIEHAKSLCSAQESDWAFVAGRLVTMDLWSNTRSYDLTFCEFVREQQELGYWVHEGFSVYSDEQLGVIGEWLDKERDLQHSYASVVTATSKYLMPGECIQHMFLGEAMILASIEPEEDRLPFIKKVYDVFSLRKHSLATPWLSNLRKGGNIASCFIVAPEDDLGSIFDVVKDSAFISKNGGGEGVDLSRCRAQGSSLMGEDGLATGVVGWIKILNDTAVYVNQSGKRKGAFTIHLPIWHRDVEDFLEIQTEAGDQRKKAHDIKPQIGVSDLFMEMKNNSDADWFTFCPYEVKTKLGIELYAVYGAAFRTAYQECVSAYHNGLLKVVKRYNAKQLWVKVMKVQFETGMPYISFLDRINEMNPNKHVGYIPCTNLCTESFSVVVPDKYAHTCNLLSLVVGRIDMNELTEMAALATHILDNGIELTQSPILESNAHNKMFRTIGVGVQGLHDLIAKEYKSYSDITFITEVAERIQYGCVTKSIELAKKRGAYPYFKGSEWDSGNLTSYYKRNSVCKDIDWDKVQSDINIYGIRNSQMTSPAPNTSTSIFMDAGAGVMPVYSAFFYEDNKDGQMPVVAMHLKNNPLSYAKDITKHLPWELTKCVGALQKFFDTGISAEYMMDKNQPSFSAKWLWDTLEAAWINGTKAVYYIRTIKKGESLVKDEGVCVGCSG